MKTLAIIVLLGAAPAWADKATADAAFSQAKQLASDGKWVEACPLFEVSYKADPQIGVLLNLADCHEHVGKTASAWAEFNEAIERAGKTGDQRQEFAQQRADALLPKLVRLTILSPAIAGLVVRRDGDDVTPILGKPVPVDPGKHELVVSAPGYIDWRKTIDVEGEGKTVAVDVPPLEKAPIKPPDPITNRVEEPKVEYDRTAQRARRSIARKIAIPGAIVTVIGAGLGFKALGDKHAAEGNCDKGFVCSEEGKQKLDSARSTARFADIALGLGLAATFAGIVVFGNAPKPVEKTRVVPTASPTGAGVSVFGTF